MKVVLADYGAGNLSSVCSALTRAGATPVITTVARELREAPLAVVAGVGHMEHAARGLATNHLDEALRERAVAACPVLGICVGMQLLFDESEEGGCGLGLLTGPVSRVRAPRVPHMGWNALEVVRSSVLLEGLDGADVYFAHSYAARPTGDISTSEVEHGERLVASVESGSIAGVQFHPERSGSAGARFLRNALEWAQTW